MEVEPMQRHWNEQELETYWSFSSDELTLIPHREASSRLGVAASLKFFQLEGFFPSSVNDIGVAIGRALQPFPRSKRSRHVSAHSAFQLGLSTLEGRMRLERRRGAPASDVLLTLPSSRAGAGKPQLAQAELQGGALEPQARCRTVRPAEHPARLLQHGQDVCALGRCERGIRRGARWRALGREVGEGDLQDWPR